MTGNVPPPTVGVAVMQWLLIWKLVYHNGNVEHRHVVKECLESKQDVSPEVAIKDHQKGASFPFRGKTLFLK